MNTSFAFAFAGILGLIVLSIGGLSGKTAEKTRYGLLIAGDLLIVIAMVLDPWWSITKDWHDIIGVAIINALIVRNIQKVKA